MLAAVQAFGLESPGGGPRIMRALLKGAAQPWMSVCVGVTPPPPCSIGEEAFIQTRPHLGRIERTRFRRYIEPFFPRAEQNAQAKLERICRDSEAACMHSIAHGNDFWISFQTADKLGIPFYLTVHDRFEYNLRKSNSLQQNVERLGVAWRNAQGRMVISQEMGDGLNALYGEAPFLTVTDGLTEIKPSIERKADRLAVYFMGALHTSYHANFRALAESLIIVQRKNPSLKVSLTIRGSSFPGNAGDLPVHCLPWGSEEEVSRDIHEADILYLPLPFGKEYEPFWRYSLSTKMVTYVGSGMPILYHGPAEAAAGRMLISNNACMPAVSLDSIEIADVLQNAQSRLAEIVGGAQILASNKFMLEDQRIRFWGMISGAGRSK